MKIYPPCFDIIATGPLSAALTALGANITGRSVSDESLSMLVGGSITGAMAGFMNCLVGCFVPTNYNSQWFPYRLFTLSLGLAASLTAPLLGEEILDNNASWGNTVVDTIIGASVIVIGAGIVSCIYQSHEGCYTLLNDAEKLTFQSTVQQVQKAVTEKKENTGSVLTKVGSFFSRSNTKAIANDEKVQEAGKTEEHVSIHVPS